MNSMSTITIFTAPTTHSRLLAYFDADDAAVLTHTSNRRRIWMTVLAMSSLWMLTSPLLDGGHTTASLAVSPFLVWAVVSSIFFGELMARIAMSLACIDGRWPITAKIVDRFGHIFKVGRIHASTISTKVIGFVVGCFYNVVEHLERNAVSISTFPIARKCAVAIGRWIDPKPTATTIKGNGGVYSYVFEKASEKFSIYRDSVRINLHNLISLKRTSCVLGHTGHTVLALQS